MRSVEEIKVAITQLTPQAQEELRAWYEEFDAQMWDQQLEADVAAGQLDRLAEKAIEAFHAGQHTPTMIASSGAANTGR